MGVYKLLAEFINKLKYGNGKPKDISELPNIQHLYMDVNGILHPVAQKTFAYHQGTFNPKSESDMEKKKLYYQRIEEIDGTSWEDLMEDYKSNLFESLMRIFDIVKPSKTYVLCVDGIAPASKIAQQRSRRYNGDWNVSNEYTTEMERKANTGFSSSFITPGSKFMEYVDEYLSEFANIIKNTKDVEVYYSSYKEPGEGEHKIFKIIDKYNIGNHTDNHAIEGLDSDLVSLTILRPKRFFLINVRDDSVKFVNIGELKKYINNSLEGPNKHKVNLYSDFVVMLYMVGNDFLPRFKFVSHVGDTMESMFEIHRKLKTTLTDIRGIRWNMMTEFLSHLRNVESINILDKMSNYHDYKWPDNIIHNHDLILDIENGYNREYVYNHFVDIYRKKTLLPNDAIYKTILNIPDEKLIESELNLMCDEFSNAFMWVLEYYRGIDIDVRWSYKRFYTPLITDWYNYLNKNYKSLNLDKIKNKNVVVDPQTQLICVTPPHHSHLIFPEYRDCIDKGGFLRHIAPIGFPVDRSGIKLEKDFFMEKVYLPHVDVDEVYNYVNQ